MKRGKWREEGRGREKGECCAQMNNSSWKKTGTMLVKYPKPTYLIVQFSGFHFKQDHSVILDFFC